MASPNTVSINDDPTTVTFQATAGIIPGPYNLYTDDCFPESGRAGGCANAFLVNVAYRVADGSGQFVGAVDPGVRLGRQPVLRLHPQPQRLP